MNTTLRQLAIHQQGLGQTSRFDAGLTGSLYMIEHMGYVQIDTISVVERAHHHVLWNRVPEYDNSHFNQFGTRTKRV